MEWETARQTCACSNGAELASVSSAAENTVVYTVAGSTENTWLGGHDRETEGTFAWSDGTAWEDSAAQWHTNQPNNAGTSGQDCVSIRLANGAWDDQVCTKQQQFVCEKPDSDQSALTANSGCSCDAGWTGSLDTGKCYKRGPAVSKYADAKADCEADSAALTSVSSELENSLVVSVLTAGDNNNNGWLGATDTAVDGTWVWDDGTTWTYQNWSPGAPLGSGNCLQLNSSDATWVDTKCDEEKWFVCKK